MTNEVVCLLLVGRCRQLQQRRTKHIASIIVRDSLRTERSKQRAVVDDIRDKQEQLRIDNDVLNLMIGRSEELMVRLRKRHGEETQKRNERSVTVQQSPSFLSRSHFYYRSNSKHVIAILSCPSVRPSTRL